MKAIESNTPPHPFWVLIPARLASTRLPDKALADLAGLPMVVRVARQAAASAATRIVVATDHDRIAQACALHGIEAVMTDASHPSGSDRLAQACQLLNAPDETIIVNVQGDEPLIDPALIQAVAAKLADTVGCQMATAAHPLHNWDDFLNPNVVKVVTDRQDLALYFSRAPIAWWRDGMQQGMSAPVGNTALPPCTPLRHIGLYAYRAGFLKTIPAMATCALESTEMLEQLRVLWHGERIAVHVTHTAPHAGVDTPEDLARVRAVLAEPPVQS
ncbi:MAG TPA: 3-deoxy-manno-octulosonate cytidylyltransferase [Burkholderiaceae bacterium]|nr:3-deoxy-manno-octulosonate cytidylyltransferase [Burkholderiaceae bacterium]